MGDRPLVAAARRIRYPGHDRHPRPSLATPYRTHTCGQLRAADAGITARLAGWVHRRRDHGQLIFLDLRDRHGITQVVIDKADAPDAHAAASRVRPEFVVTVAGDGRAAPARHREHRSCRPAPSSSRRPTSTILSEAKTPPFYINEPDAPVDESAPAASTATSTSAASRCSAGCCSAAGWSRRSARSTTPTASSRSRRRP